MNHVRRVALCTIAIAWLIGGVANGQTTTATVRGRVLDPQGRPVASATITVSSQDSGISRTSTTAPDGTFVVSNLPPTAVDLTVSAPGFMESHRSGLVLEVGRTTALEIELTVGRVQETVDVGVVATPSTPRDRSSMRS